MLAVSIAIHRPLAPGDRMNISLHDPELYFFLCMLTSIAALLAVIYDFPRRKPGRWNRAKPLDGLLSNAGSPEAQRLKQRSRTRL